MADETASAREQFGWLGTGLFFVLATDWLNAIFDNPPLLSWPGVVVTLLASFIVGGIIHQYEKSAKAEGYQVGHEEGHEEGYEEGYDEGLQDGRNQRDRASSTGL